MGKDLQGKELGKWFRQRKDGRYEARFKKGDVEIHLYGRNFKQLKRDFNNALKCEELELDHKYRNITLDEWFELWFDTYKLPRVKEQSVYPMKSKYYKTFGCRIGDRKLSSIKNMDIQAVLNELQEEGRAHSSMREALGRLKECLECAKNNDIIRHNPAFDIIVPWQRRKHERRFLTPEEEMIFLKQAETSWYKEVLHVMLNSGLRIGEVGGLTWDDIDFRKKTIHVRKQLMCQYDKGKKTLKMTSPKTYNSDRRIPFLGNVEEMLYSQEEKQQRLIRELGDRYRCPEEYNLVFVTSMGSPVTRYILGKEINNIVEEINLKENIEAIKENRNPIVFEKVYPHALRHTFCSRCFERGLNPKVVQKLMGHQNYSTTIDIYTHVTENAYDEEVRKFNMGISGDPPAFGSGFGLEPLYCK